MSHTVWETRNLKSRQPFIFEDPDANLVLAGDLITSCDITLKVNNLIITGTLKSLAGTISIKTENDCFALGRFFCNNLKISSKEGHIFYDLNAIAIERINALGIVFRDPPRKSFDCKKI